jgi:predicted double-glycine peptidase
MYCYVVACADLEQEATVKWIIQRIMQQDAQNRARSAGTYTRSEDNQRPPHIYYAKAPNNNLFAVTTQHQQMLNEC